jgi:fatty acid hydroxylase family protein
VSTARLGEEVKTLSQARADFFRRPSPYVIGMGIALALALRVWLGDFSWRDPVAIAAMLAVYPFAEWAIHVHILHLKPLRIRGRPVEIRPAKNHREHHGTPNRIDMLLLGPAELAQLMLGSTLIVIVAGAALLAIPFGWPPLGPLVSAAATGYCCIFIYEWSHFLIHTAYVPQRGPYRAVWRNHRLHHFKNEHFWHGITNNLSDKIMGTDPDQRTVRKSDTARTLGVDTPP